MRVLGGCRIGEPGYNAEVRRLVASRGVPAWGLKSRLVSDGDLIQMLTSTNMKQITSYHCNLSPNIVLFLGGGTTPWGTTFGSNTKYLEIESRQQQNGLLPLPQLGEETDPAFIGQLPQYPGTYFVRCGKSAVACTSDGWIIQCLMDER